MTTFLLVPLYVQSYLTCFPTSVSMVLDYYDTGITYAQVEQAATRASNMMYVADPSFIAGLAGGEVTAQGVWTDDAQSLINAELASGDPVIVIDGSHALVVVGFSGDKTLLIDPLSGRYIWYYPQWVGSVEYVILFEQE